MKFRSVPLFLVLLAALPTGLEAQYARVEPQAVEVGVNFQGVWMDFEDDAVSADRGFKQWARLPFSGYVVDRSFMTFSVGIRPGLAQNFDGTGNRSTDLKQLDFDASVQMFSTSRFTLGFGGSRSHGTTSGSGLALSSEFDVGTLYTSIGFQNRPFPMRLLISHRNTRNEIRQGPGALPIRHDEGLRTIRLEGRSSKTTTVLERIGFTDQVTGSTYDAFRGSLNHMFRWGKGSSLASALNYTDRDTRNLSSQNVNVPSSRFLWSERVHLQHARTVSSEYGFSRQSSDIGGVRSGASNVEISARWDVTSWFDVDASGSRRTASFGGADEIIRTVSPGARFRFVLPEGGRLAGAGRLGINSRSARGDGGEAVVIAERHEVPPTRTFELDLDGLVEGTVTVSNSDETIIYVEGADYIVDRSSALVRIDIPPTSRIQPGDRLLVNYRYAADIDRSQSSFTANYNVSLAMFGFTLSHRKFVREAENAGAVTRTIQDFVHSTTTLTTTRATPLGRARIELSRQKRVSESFDFTAYEIGGSLALPPLHRIRSSVSTHWRDTRGTEQDVNTISVTGDAAWAVSRSLVARGQLEMFSTDRRDQRSEKFVGATIDLQWRVGQLETSLRYERRWRDLDVRGTIDRLSMSLVRHF